MTGLGAVTPMGVGIAALWDGLLAGKCALAPISLLDASGFSCSIGGECKGFAAKDHVPKAYRKAVKVMARDIELAVGAAKAAVEDAALQTRGTQADWTADVPCTTGTYPSERMGCQIGAGLIAAETDELALAAVTARDANGVFDSRAWGTVAAAAPAGTTVGGMNNLQPLWMLKYLPNMLACHVTIIHGCEGPSNTITCWEASGLLSLGEGVRVIQRNAAEMCFSGGAESKLSHMGLLRLQLSGRLAHVEASTPPESIVKPYDPASTGTAAGESGAIIVTEEYESAKKRGTKIYAEIKGFGAAHGSARFVGSRDCALAGNAVDDGLLYAILNALEDAGLDASQVDAIVPLASGIPAVDRAEEAALREVFGARLAQIPIVPLAPFIGIGPGGHSAVMAAVAAKMIQEQVVPPALHAGKAAAGLDVSRRAPTPKALNNVLVCSGSLGGQNAAILLGKV